MTAGRSEESTDGKDLVLPRTEIKIRKGHSYPWQCSGIPGMEFSTRLFIFVFKRALDRKMILKI